MEKIYRVQMNKSGMPNFSTAEEMPPMEWWDKNSHTKFCSNCGYEDTGWHLQEWKYCPYCGHPVKGAEGEDN